MLCYHSVISQEWLKISKKSEPKCELCGTLFCFTKKYCDDTPDRLSVFEFFAGVLPRVGSFTSTMLWGLSLIFIWVIFIPLWTSWTIENTLEYLFEGSVRLNRFDKFDSFVDLGYFWLKGLLVCFIILTCTAGITELVIFIRAEINGAVIDAAVDELEANINNLNDDGSDQGGDDDSVDENIDATRADGVALGHDSEGLDDEESGCWSDASSDEESDDEEYLQQQQQQLLQPLEQLEQLEQLEHQPNLMEADMFANDAPMIDVGAMLSLSITSTLKWCFQVGLFFFFIIQVCVLLPTLLGRFIIYHLGSGAKLMNGGILLWEMRKREIILSGENMFKLGGDNATDVVNNSLAEEKKAFLANTVVGCEFVVGWSVVVSLLVAASAIWLYNKIKTTPETHLPGIDASRARVKLSLLLHNFFNWTTIANIMVIEMAIIPQCVGWTIDMVTLKAFGTTLAARHDFFHENPLLSSSIHFMVGFFFINLVNMFTSELRRVLKASVMGFLLPEPPPLDDNFALDVMWDDSALKLLHRVLLTLFYSVPAILVMIMLPMSFGHHFCPFATPLRLNFNDLYHDIQLPLELLVFQFLLPFLTQKFSLRQLIRFVMTRYVVLACHGMGVDDLLDDEVVASVLRTQYRDLDGVEVRVEAFREQNVGEDGLDEVNGDGSGDDNVDAVADNVDDRDGGGTEDGVDAAPLLAEAHGLIGDHVPRNQVPRGRSKMGVIKSLKVLVLALGGLFVLFLGSVWFIHVPVIIGRVIMKYYFSYFG